MEARSHHTATIKSGVKYPRYLPTDRALIKIQHLTHCVICFDKLVNGPTGQTSSLAFTYRLRPFLKNLEIAGLVTEIGEIRSDQFK